jgi:DNA invertase Pin-like site-specific DNA recombinase
MKANYIRVSSTGQNTERQENGTFDFTYTDKISGSVAFKERPEAKKLFKGIENGTIKEVHVHSIDRLGRNTIDILTTIKEITSFGCNVISVKEGLSMLIDGKANPVANMLIGILSTLAEFELTRIKERQREGIEKAKVNGTYKVHAGRSVDVDFLNKPKSILIAKYLKAGESVRRTAKLCECSPSLVQKVIKELSA